jgi:DNA repair protein RadD
MSAPLCPRPDQLAAHDTIVSALDAGIRRPLCVAPMAWGKSLLLGMLATTFARRGKRILILAHRRELLQQNHGVLRRLDPDADVGICSASLQHDNTSARIVVGGTATIYRRLHRLSEIDIILIDESHRLSASSTSMLARIIEALGNPPVVGLTATPFRGDGISLIESGIFEAIAYEVTITDALAAGLLRRLVTKASRVGQIDMRRVSITAGEFNAAEMEQAAMASDTTRLAIARTVEVARAEDRHSWLIFSAGVAHARQIGEELERHGVSYAVVVGETDSDERSTAIAQFRAGAITVLVNCNVFTEGFDVTRIDLIAFLRATCSPVLWIQSAGRGMRLHPGLSDCRLLDFGNNLLRHGPIDGVVLRKAGERHDADRGADRVRVCPHCDEVNERTAVVCVACGEHLVKPPTPPAPRNYDGNLEPRESELAALGGGRRQWTRTYSCSARIYRKEGGQPCLHIRYRTEAGVISEFLAVEHVRQGARWHAARRWRELSRRPQAPPPISAAEALARIQHGELRHPTALLVEQENGWPRIRQTTFDELEPVA